MLSVKDKKPADDGQLPLQHADDLDDRISKMDEHSYAKRFTTGTDLSSEEGKRIHEKARHARNQSGRGQQIK
jgi:hypothetical protein